MRHRLHPEWPECDPTIFCDLCAQTILEKLIEMHTDAAGMSRSGHDGAELAALIQKHKPLALISLGEFQCLHTYAYYGFFKPSVAEVLAQLPERFLSATHFEIVNSPRKASDLNDQKKALNAGFHVSTVRVYKVVSME
jgi:hypothetical protein